MRSVLIIGLGRFGRHLTLTMSQLGHEIMAIDKNEEVVNKIAPYVTSAQIGDCSDPVVLKSIGVSNFDLCFVCISNDLESSLVITTLLKEYHAKKVITKVNQDIHAKFLLQNGADDVIYPERDMAKRTAMKYSTLNAFDYIELSPEYGIFEIIPPKSWIGRSLSEVNVRKKFHVNVMAYKDKNTNEIMPLDREQYFFKSGEHLLVAGNQKNFDELITSKKI